MTTAQHFTTNASSRTIGCAALGLALCFWLQPSLAVEPRTPQRPDFSGVWQLDENSRDQAAERIAKVMAEMRASRGRGGPGGGGTGGGRGGMGGGRGGMGGGRGGMGGGRGGMGGGKGGMGGSGGSMGGRGETSTVTGQHPLQHIVAGMETLAIAHADGVLEVIDARDRQETLPVNGTPVVRQTRRGEIVGRASWHERSIVARLEIKDQMSVRKIYDLATDDTQLIVAVRIELTRTGEKIDLRLVYNAVS